MSLLLSQCSVNIHLMFSLFVYVCHQWWSLLRYHQGHLLLPDFRSSHPLPWCPIQPNRQLLQLLRLLAFDHRLGPCHLGDVSFFCRSLFEGLHQPQRFWAIEPQTVHPCSWLHSSCVCQVHTLTDLPLALPLRMLRSIKELQTFESVCGWSYRLAKNFLQAYAV